MTLAFDLLVKELGSRDLPHSVVNATFRGAVAKSGTFSLGRALETLFVIFSVWWHLLFCKVYYATMSTSQLGFIRDYLTVGFASILRRETVLHLHGGGFEDFYTSQKPWMQRLIRSNLKRVDRIVVLGELLKEQFYCAGDFVKPKLIVVPNGLTLGVDEPEARVCTVPTATPVQLLYLSSLMPTKGFFDVVQAMEHLQRQDPGRFHLNLCGQFVNAVTEQAIEVTDESSLKAYLDAHDLTACVTYHGQVVDAAKAQQFEQASMFLLPTSYPWEGQPLSIIEALAYSTPVISCPHKGIPELVQHGTTGLFVEPGSPQQIADAVIELASNDEAYAQISAAARQHYEANFKREVHLNRLISVILDTDDAAPSSNMS